MSDIATVAELLVKIGADGSGLRKEIAASQRQLKRGFGPEALGASEAVVGIMAGLSAAIGAVGLASVKMAADMEQNRIAFATMLGSATEADAFLRNLATFAEKTPFEFPGLVQNSKKLLAMGYAAQEVIPTLTAIGDAVAAVGGGADVLDRVTLAFGQMRAKGSVSAEEMKQLAEAGIPAWQMLADTIGKTIPETMKLAEQKAINAEAAVAGMIAQMGTKYGGMMEKQSQTITGALSNIQDKAGAIMRDMGDEIVKALDLQTKMQGTLAFLDDLASRVRRSGVKEAMMEMIPPALEPAIYAIAGAITFAMIPALTSMAMAAWAALAPLWPLMAIGAAVFGTAWGIQRVAESTANATSEADGFVASFGGVEKSAVKAANAIEGGLSRIGGADDYGDYVERKAAEMAEAAEKAAAKTKGSLIDTSKAGEDAWKKIQAAAERTSESIEREWVQTTKTQLEQLDVWQTEQLTALSESKAANENYERDKERVSATYSARRTKILQNEAQDALNLFNKMSDGWESIQNGISSFGLKGSNADLTSMALEAQSRIKDIGKYYADIQSEFSGADDAKKDKILANLEEIGTVYKLTEQGNLDFSQTIADQTAAIYQQAEDKRTEYFATGQAIRAEMQAAYDSYDLERYMAILNEENAAKLSQLEGQQEMMDVYQQIQMESNRSAISYLAEAYGTLYDGMTTAFSDMLTGAKSIDEAFSGLGKSIGKMIANWVAQWIAGRLMMAIFGKTTMAAETALSVAAAATTAAAWSKAAAMVSLASFGANAAPAMAGITATVGLSSALALVPMATGGIVTGPTPALIGEGRYDEAVIPLNKRMFEKLGFTGGGKSVQVTQNNYGDINREVDYDQIQSDLGDAIGAALMGA